MTFFTIGVYNSTEEQFFEKLRRYKIDTFCDIRQRRGVRGSKYAFVNSEKLQQRLSELGVCYKYIKDLSPTKEVRQIQTSSDKEIGQLKKERVRLDHGFINEYKKQILDKFDFDVFLNELNYIEANAIVLFCVEDIPEACHRSIVTNKLKSLHYKIIHL